MFKTNSLNEILMIDEVSRKRESIELQQSKNKVHSHQKKGLALLLHQGGFKICSSVFLAICLMIGCFLAYISSHLSNQIFTPIFFALGCCSPFMYLEQRISKRSRYFSDNYADFLLAISSSVKTGVTIDRAFERAAKLLPNSSILKNEVNQFLEHIENNLDRTVAMMNFGCSIRLPELELFRSAYLLSHKNGGKLSPSLLRLALITKDRSTLHESAKVSTTTMRMTANFIVLLAPLFLFLLSRKNQNYVNLLLHDDQTNLIACTGIIMIMFGYIILYMMSNFRP